MEGFKNMIILIFGLVTLFYAPVLFLIGLGLFILNWLLTNVVNEQKADAILNNDKKDGKK